MARQAFTKLVLLVLLVILVVQFYMLSYLSTDKTDSSSIVTRDFKRYKCLNRVRIGGQWDSVKAAKDDLLFRIDGAWFICADKLVGPRVYHCTVLSFGISFDDSFDLSMNEKYGCHVHSFDPNVEARRFLEARIRRHGKVDDPVKYSRIKVKNNWHFYRFGLTGIAVPPSENSNETTQRNNLLTIEQIYDLTGTRNQVIDIWKMDIEGHERAVFENLDMDYVCKYVKQFMFETHWDLSKHECFTAFEVLSKLEQCFHMFHRDTRFNERDGAGPTGHLTEFQNRKSVALPLEKFNDEIELATCSFVLGELYFVNVNFIK